MSVKQIFDELKIIKLKHDRCEKNEKNLNFVLIVVLALFFVTGKMNVKNVYWSIWIVLPSIILIDTTKKDMCNKQLKYVLEYRDFYKDNFIPMVLNNYYEVIRYLKIVDYDKEQLKYVTYIAELENVIVKNYFEGIHKGVNFIQAVIKTDIIHAGEYGESACFNGRFFMMEIHKNVDFVYIYSKNYNNKPGFMKELNRLKTEDIEFNSYFDIAAANPEEAFYVLTPHFMNVLTDLYKRYGAVGVLCKNKHIYVIFSQLNEQSCDIDANITKDLDYFTETSRIKNFFGLVNVLIDELGMNLCVTENDKYDDNEEDEAEEKKRRTEFLGTASAVINEIYEMEDVGFSETAIEDEMV